jgi:uncharacterized protein YpmB
VRKFILILILLVLIVIGVFYKIYFSALEPVKIAEKKAVAIAERKVNISKIDDFHLYNGVETVDIIECKNKQGENLIIWIPEKSKKMIIKRAKSGLSKEDAIRKLEESKNPRRIVSVKLGMEKNIPFWEIYYLSKDNLINYYYVHFETGEWLKKIENL